MIRRSVSSNSVSWPHGTRPPSHRASPLPSYSSVNNDLICYFSHFFRFRKLLLFVWLLRLSLRGFFPPDCEMRVRIRNASSYKGGCVGHKNVSITTCGKANDMLRCSLVSNLRGFWTFPLFICLRLIWKNISLSTFDHCGLLIKWFLTHFRNLQLNRNNSGTYHYPINLNVCTRVEFFLIRAVYNQLWLVTLLFFLKNRDYWSKYRKHSAAECLYKNRKQLHFDVKV